MKRARHRNGGLRKRCDCSRKHGPKCPHSWHLNFKPRRGPLAGTAFRLSLDRELGRQITSKTEAEAEATNIRAAILAGTFRAVTPIPAAPTAALTFRAFADIWTERRGKQLVSAPIDVYRLSTICAFVLPGTDPVVTIGQQRLDAITLDNIEAFREMRKAKGSLRYR